MKARRTLVLVADGARARILREPGSSADGGDRLEDLVFEADHKRLREIMSDRPGRSFASQGARRSAMEYHSDPVRGQEEEFAATLVSQLVRHHAAGDFDRLAIVAEPRMLGHLRQKLPAFIRKLITSEAARDLTKLPTDKLRDAILAPGIDGLHVNR